MKLIQIGKYSALLALVACVQAHATYTVSLFQDGNDVVANGSGTINLSELTPSASGEDVTPYVMGQPAVIAIGGAGGVLEMAYDGIISGPNQIGISLNENTTSVGSGDLVGIAKILGRVIVPASYVSGAPLSSDSRWRGTSIASLGLTPGSYTWTWGNGSNADSFVLNIATPPSSLSSVPTLSEWALFSLAALIPLVGYRLNARKRSA